MDTNVIYNEDCLEGMKRIPDNSIDLVVTDPPYRFENKGGGFYAKNNSTKRKYLDSLRQNNCTEFNPEPMLKILKNKLKKFYGYFFCNKSLINDYLNYAIKNNYKYDLLVMAKSNPIPAYSNHHLSDLEYIVMIREEGTYFSNHKNIDDYRKWYKTSCKKRKHPSQKDIEIIEQYIKVSSQRGDIILDPFIGSGTTAVACLKNNRRFIGFELEEKYYNIALKRIGKLDKKYYEQLPEEEKPNQTQLF